MTETGSSTNVSDIWLTGLVAALEIMACAPAPSAQVMTAFLRHLGSVPAAAAGAAETVPEWPSPQRETQVPLPPVPTATH